MGVRNSITKWKHKNILNIKIQQSRVTTNGTIQKVDLLLIYPKSKILIITILILLSARNKCTFTKFPSLSYSGTLIFFFAPIDLDALFQCCRQPLPVRAIFRISLYNFLLLFFFLITYFFKCKQVCIEMVITPIAQCSNLLRIRGNAHQFLSHAIDEQS